jgi:predicted short-subunit dehydrogenase-like oxidoreductase (DUF2520 family)
MHGITIVGPGRVGGALAVGLSEAGYGIDSLIYRNHRPRRSLSAAIGSNNLILNINKVQSIGSPIVIIATQDQELEKAVSSLSAKLKKGAVVFHTSGSISSDVLNGFREFGCSVASIHPLASITNWTDGIKRFPGSYFCLEGDNKAVRIGAQIAKRLGAYSFKIDSRHKSLYHAAALTSAGHTIALFDIAVGFMTKAGVDRKMARRLLQPLLLGVAQNLADKDTDSALTGTYARGDESTMHRHLKALYGSATDDEIELYIELALRSIDLAGRRGSLPTKTNRMRKELLVAKRKTQ